MGDPYGVEYTAGYGDGPNGRSFYYDQVGDGNLHVFPDGIPPERHERIDHPHTVINPDGGVEEQRGRSIF